MILVDRLLAIFVVQYGLVVQKEERWWWTCDVSDCCLCVWWMCHQVIVVVVQWHSKVVAWSVVVAMVVQR